MTWEVRLEGGPFDGDNGRVDPPLTPKMWVEVCPRGICGTHWYRSAVRGCEVYKLKEQDDKARNAKYVYDGLGQGGGGEQITEEVDNGEGIKRRELIPA